MFTGHMVCFNRIAVIKFDGGLLRVTEIDQDMGSFPADIADLHRS
jgi:hypothetical protein